MLVVATAVVLALALGGCGRTFRCPERLPGSPGDRDIPVLLVEDDTGRPVSRPRTGPGAPAYACEADANRNRVGDEHEVELLEQALNGGED